MLRKDVTKGSPTTVGTTDRTEIARFDALAEEWWKPDGAFKVVHAFNRVRVGHIAERLPALLQRDPRAARPLAGLNVIDVGCGAGLVTEPISRLGADVLGIDAAERNVAGRRATCAAERCLAPLQACTAGGLYRSGRHIRRGPLS